MVFNSLDFLIFLPIVFICYWFLFSKKIKIQNSFLLLASYLFYGLWDWRFLFLIFASTLVDFIIGQAIYNSNSDKKRKTWLWFSVIFNVGLLGFFKYYNFFIDSWVDFISVFGYDLKSSWTLQIILPVGISFYTFQTMSYSLDIFYKRLKPTKDFISFATFVSFFPQLVAGPIERASNLLSQITTKRTFDSKQCIEGLKLILWGMFKKVVIADSIAPIVDDIFANYTDYPASTLILGVSLFSFQVYGDFSGYSDIAIGTSKLFGIELMSNFKFPTFSRNVAEYWQRWHVSLSTWFRHYIYIPLGGNRVGKIKSIRNIIIIFLVSGFWHGPNWTFIIWGLIHALLFLPLLLFNRNRANMEIIAHDRMLPSIIDILRILTTFFLVTLAWVFFRAETVGDAFVYLSGIFDKSVLTMPSFEDGYKMIYLWLIFGVFLLIEWLGRRGKHALERIDAIKYRVVRWSIYSFLIFVIGMYMRSEDIPFIYFQF